MVAAQLKTPHPQQQKRTSTAHAGPRSSWCAVSAGALPPLLLRPWRKPALNAGQLEYAWHALTGVCCPAPLPPGRSDPRYLHGQARQGVSWAPTAPAAAARPAPPARLPAWRRPRRRPPRSTARRRAVVPLWNKDMHHQSPMQIELRRTPSCKHPVARKSGCSLSGGPTGGGGG